jgi:hypothetical protein
MSVESGKSLTTWLMVYPCYDVEQKTWNKFEPKKGVRLRAALSSVLKIHHNQQ